MHVLQMGPWTNTLIIKVSTFQVVQMLTYIGGTRGGYCFIVSLHGYFINIMMT